jgi:hypothetical protein
MTNVMEPQILALIEILIVFSLKTIRLQRIKEIASNKNSIAYFAARSELISESKNNFTESKKDIRLQRHCRIYERTDSHWPFGGCLRAIGHLFQIFKIARKRRFVCLRKRRTRRGDFYEKKRRHYATGSNR